MKAVILVMISILFINNCTSKQEESQKKITEKIIERPINDELDKFQGVYTAVFPCGDCSGIEYKLFLDENLTFISRSKYLGKGDVVFKEEGSWTIVDEKLTLRNLNDEKIFFKISTDEVLVKLDINGNEIKGSTSELYKLNKKLEFTKTSLKNIRIFERPSQYGLRGDAYLWKELERLFMLENIDNEEEFKKFLLDNIIQIVGKDLEIGITIYVEKYNHGGMSGGQISSDFWLNKGIPILIKQFKEVYP